MPDKFSVSRRLAAGFPLQKQTDAKEREVGDFDTAHRNCQHFF